MAEPSEVNNVETEDVETVKQDPEVVPEVEKIGETKQAPETNGNKAQAIKSLADLQPMLKRNSKSEKKVRKAMAALGLKPMPGVVKILLKRSNGTHVVSSPDIYRCPLTNLFVFFGDPKAEEEEHKLQMEAAQRFAAKKPVPQPSAVEEVEEEELSAEGLNEEDVRLVISQCGVSKNQAIKALRDNNGDFVQAIMNLT